MKPTIPLLVLCLLLATSCTLLEDAGFLPVEPKTTKVALRYAFESPCVDPKVLAFTKQTRELLVPVTNGGAPDVVSARQQIEALLVKLPAPSCTVQLRTQVLLGSVQVLSFSTTLAADQ